VLCYLSRIESVVENVYQMSVNVGDYGEGKAIYNLVFVLLESEVKGTLVVLVVFLEEKVRVSVCLNVQEGCVSVVSVCQMNVNVGDYGEGKVIYNLVAFLKNEVKEVLDIF